MEAGTITIFGDYDENGIWVACYNSDTINDFCTPLVDDAGLKVLWGNSDAEPIQQSGMLGEAHVVSMFDLNGHKALAILARNCIYRYGQETGLVSLEEIKSASISIEHRGGGEIHFLSYHEAGIE